MRSKMHLFTLSLAAFMALAGCDKTAKEAPLTLGQIKEVQDPAADRARAKKELENAIGDKVYFSLGQNTLSAKAREVLIRQAAWLKKYPGMQITVAGHCDKRGTREFNIALGSRRANSVKEFLVAQGICPSSINTMSYGKDRLSDDGSNDAAHARNRVVLTCVGSCYS